MALRFENRNFQAKRNEAGNSIWTLEIYDTEWTSGVEAFDCDSPGNALRWTPDSDDRWASILSSELTFSFRMETSGHEAFIDDLVISAEGRFSVRLSATLLDTTYWAGVVLADIVSYEDRNPIVFQVRATDGIGALRKIDYKGESGLYTGKATYKDHLINCLNKLSYLGEHFAINQLFLRTAVDWWETTMTNASANDPLALSYVDHSAFYKFEKGDQKPRTVYEVLDDICKVWGARLWQHDGCFWFEQPSYRQGNFVTRRYDTSGDYLGFTAHTDRTTVAQEAGGISWESFIQYSYFPALLRSEVEFNTFERRNYITGMSLDASDNTYNVNYFINKAEEGTGLRFMLTMYVTLKNISYTGGLYTPLYVKMRGRLRIGGYWWERSGYIQGGFYQINYSPSVVGQWTADGPTPDPATPVFDTLIMFGGIPPTGLNTYQTFQFSIDLPDLQGDAISLYLDMEHIEVLDYQGVPLFDQTDVEITWTIPEGYLGVFSDGQAAQYDDYEVYEVNNNDTANSEVGTVEVLTGSSTNINTIGAIYVSGGDTLGGFWGSGTDTPESPIGYILARAMMGGQLRPIKRISATLYGVFDVWPLVEWKAKNWLFQGGEFDFEFNRLSGNWYELDYGTTFNATPIKRKKRLIVDPDQGTTFPPWTPGGGGGNGPNIEPERAMAPGGTINSTNADAFTGFEITAGVKTTIPIRTNIYAGQFWANQTITLMNPLTGTLEQLTITADSEDGDTAIAVSGTLQANYPPDALVLTVKEAGIYPFPKGVFGDILYFDGFRWRKTTISALLFTTLPTYVSDEQAMANGLFEGDFYIAASNHYAVKGGTLTSVIAS